ncbi:MAG: type IV pilus modification PilV family protein [Planctomycetota bacterium]
MLQVRKLQNNKGFSLTEVLFAVGTLAVGMLFVAGTFPVAIYFSTIATERTVAAVVADEAFAKIRLYAIGSPNDPNDDFNLGLLRVDYHTDFNDANVFPATFGIDPNEFPNGFAYPSDPDIHISEKKYYWSALCRRVVDPIKGPTQSVQVTVFVSRKIGSGTTYWRREPVTRLPNPIGWYPAPVDVNVIQIIPDANELSIVDVIQGDVDERTFINDGYTILDDETGQIYRVLERYAAPDDDRIRLDRRWGPGIVPDKIWRVWVVPPPVNGGRYPCIAIYQRVISF